jgi:hypothetical protein
MKKLNHNTLESAKRELVKAGFVDIHTNALISPQIWAKSKDKRRYAIAREDRARCTKWHITEVTEQ